MMYGSLGLEERRRLALIAAKAAYLVSGRIAQWERDADLRTYWTSRFREIFEDFGVDRDTDILARAAFQKFGYVANWDSSPKARGAWIRRMAVALDAMNSAPSRELPIEVVHAPVWGQSR